MTRRIFKTKELVCDLIWTHPDMVTLETIPQRQNLYSIFQYPSDGICATENRKPVFIVTKNTSYDDYGWYLKRTLKSAKKLVLKLVEANNK